MSSSEAVHSRHHILYFLRGLRVADTLEDVYHVERSCAVEVVLQESPQFKASLVQLQVLRVVDFDHIRKHHKLSFQKRSDHRAQCGVNVNVQLPVDLFVRQLLVHDPDAVGVLSELLERPVVQKRWSFVSLAGDLKLPDTCMLA